VVRHPSLLVFRGSGPAGQHFPSSHQQHRLVDPLIYFCISLHHGIQHPLSQHLRPSHVLVVNTHRVVRGHYWLCAGDVYRGSEWGRNGQDLCRSVPVWHHL